MILTKCNIEYAQELSYYMVHPVKRCDKCAWVNPDTCKQCAAGRRTVVMAVNKGGIKR